MSNELLCVSPPSTGPPPTEPLPDPQHIPPYVIKEEPYDAPAPAYPLGKPVAKFRCIAPTGQGGRKFRAWLRARRVRIRISGLHG